MFKNKKNQINKITNSVEENINPPIENEYTLPLVMLDGDIVGPEINTFIDIDDESSILAVDDATKDNNLICFVNQFDLSDSEESASKRVCCIADIKEVIKMGQNTIRVSVKGIHRGIIWEYVTKEPFISVKVVVIGFPDDILTSDHEALFAILKERYLKYLALIGRQDSLYDKQIADQHPDKAIDVMSANLPLSEEEYYRIMEEVDTSERIKIAIETLANLTNVAEMEIELERQLVLNLSNEQRSRYLREKKYLINKELNEEDEEESIDEYRDKLEALPLNDEYKKRLLKEMDRLEMTPMGSQEASVIQSYLDYILDLPWDKTVGDDFDMRQAQDILDQEHFGMDKVKERILEYLAVVKLTSELKSPILCLVGPPGVGKTSIAKSIANATNRKFIRVSLGGMHDEAEIRGHRKTYVGAMPGRIITGLRQVQSKNPVFLLDEIDKLTKDIKGDPASALLEALDPEQNMNFTDNYIEIPFDLSNVMFITTANVTNTIPKPLLDRLEVIELSGYMPSEKLQIAKKYLIPKQLEANGLTEENLTLNDELLEEIIHNYTRESGVRQLERSIASLCRKAAKKIVLEQGDNLAPKVDDLIDLLGKRINSYDIVKEESLIGIVNGLAWTSVGGDTLQIEIGISNGSGKLELTGSMGDVMKESAKTAIGHLKSNASAYELSSVAWDKIDIHVHVPEGAVPKDGPSAGITMTTALISALSNRPVSQKLAMTGEITLSGNVLPIGGLKEKLLAANRATITSVIIPKENEDDLRDIPKNILDTISVSFAQTMNDVYRFVFQG